MEHATPINGSGELSGVLADANEYSVTPDNINAGRNYIVRAMVYDGPEPRQIVVKGQEARSLVALVRAGAAGRTAIEVSSWALRFAAYCHNLKRNHGLNIVTLHEGHDGKAGRGWHGRHVLLTRVVLL